MKPKNTPEQECKYCLHKHGKWDVCMLCDCHGEQECIMGGHNCLCEPNYCHTHEKIHTPLLDTEAVCKLCDDTKQHYHDGLSGEKKYTLQGTEWEKAKKIIQDSHDCAEWNCYENHHKDIKAILTLLKNKESLTLQAVREKLEEYKCDFNWDFEKDKAKHKSYIALDDVLKLLEEEIWQQ